MNITLATDLCAGRCTRPQVTALLSANLAGEGFELGSTSVYEEQRLLDLLDLPAIDRDHLREVLPGDVAVIARQGARTDVEDATLDPTRDWYGVDALAVDAEQRLASGRWWQFQEHRRGTINQALAETGRVPLLVSVGGYVFRGYDILGWDYSATEQHHLRGGSGWAFNLSADRPDWAEAVEGSWLHSGQGGPLLVWVL